MSKSREQSAQVLRAAWLYAAQGWSVIPLPFRQKNPGRQGWQNLRLGPEELEREFGERLLNLGVLLGEPSGGLADVDSDTREAVLLSRIILPPTPLCFGRPGKPLSHSLYVTRGRLATRKYVDPIDKAVLLEVRSTGAQTVFPPSTHPGGERISWAPEAEEGAAQPLEIAAGELLAHTDTLAAAALLARRWPAQGSRHDAALALAGMLLRAGFEAHQAANFIREVARAAGDEEWQQRGLVAPSTARTLDQGGQATGIPTLAALLGDAVVAKVCEWLGVERAAGRWQRAGDGDERAEGRWLRAGDGELSATGYELPAASTQYPVLSTQYSVLSYCPLPSALSSWPEPPAPEAFAGFLGEVVEALGPHTEADPVGIAAHVLAGFGAAIGKGPHMMVGPSRHEPRVFFALVGRTSKARKGESWAAARLLLDYADREFCERRVLGGLSTGEGLIASVRDATERQEKKHTPEGGEEWVRVVVEAGEEDKRLLVVETEFGRPLASMSRQGNTLSSVIRDAWYRGDLSTMTKTPVRATGAHITMVVHITNQELRRLLNDVEAFNGFANRFAWLAVRRSKLLPDPEPFEGPPQWRLGGTLAGLIAFARGVRMMERDEEARELWREIYAELGAEREGLVGSILARGEPQVLRLAMLYALLDRSAIVRAAHLRAALALWRYAERSALHIFGDSSGNRLADTIQAALRVQGRLTRTQLYRVFSGHMGSRQLDEALATLVEQGRVLYYQGVGAAGRLASFYQLADAGEPGQEAS